MLERQAQRALDAALDPGERVRGFTVCEYDNDKVVLRRLEAHHMTPRAERDAENDVNNFEMLTPNEHRLRHSSQPES